MKVPKNYYRIGQFTNIEFEKIENWTTNNRNHPEKLKVFKSDPLNEDVRDEEFATLFEIYKISMSVEETWELLKKTRAFTWYTIAFFEMDDAGLLEKQTGDDGKIRYKLIEDQEKIKRWTEKNNIRMPENL